MRQAVNRFLQDDETPLLLAVFLMPVHTNRGLGRGSTNGFGPKQSIKWIIAVGLSK